MTRADLIRIYAENSEQERNEKAEAQRLSKARAELDKKLNEEDSCRKRKW